MAVIKGCRVWIYCAFTVILLSTVVQAFDSWQEYWGAWEKTPYYPRLYPFKDEFHDEIQSWDTTYVDAEIQYELMYYGRKYKHVAIAIGGHLELSKTEEPSFTPKGPRQEWPNEDYPDEPDPPLIAPYLSRFELGAGFPGKLYWRRIDPSEEGDPVRQDIERNLLEVLSHDVRANLVGGDRFKASRGLMVTWYDMTFKECGKGNDCPKNTVQAIILANDIETYVIYNYYNLTWTGSASQGCHPDTGVDSGNDQCFEAYAGFNAGKAEHFRELPGSNRQAVRNLHTYDTTGILGRFLYRVDLPVYIRGGCSEEQGQPDPYVWPMEIYPRHGSMLGGEVIYVSGPCFHPESIIKCRFQNIEVSGNVVNGTKSKAMCVMPRMWEIGKIQLCVSENGGVDYYFCTHFMVVPPYKEPRVALDNAEGQWHVRDPRQLLAMSWDEHVLADFHHPDDDGSGHILEVALLGYVESEDEDGQPELYLKELAVLEDNLQNDGYFSFRNFDVACTVDCGWEKPLPPVGLIQVRRKGGDPTHPICIWSDPTPLGWFYDDYMITHHGDDWPLDVCMEWHSEEEEHTDWREDLIPCPFTLNHALNDYGQYRLDSDCEMENPPPKCPRQPGTKITCLDDILPLLADSEEGPPADLPASSKCCYDEDGMLMFSGDNALARGSNRANPYGARPYQQPAMIPVFSHWFHDINPYVVCCNWTAEEDFCIEQYMSMRPTADIEPYHSPKHALAFGDPHFLTFDGVPYTFNGRGEYWLLRTMDLPEKYDNINIQGRMQSPLTEMSPESPMNATVMTAIAIQEGTTQDQTIPKVEIRLPDEIDMPIDLMVYVNGRIEDFMSSEFMAQDYSDVAGTRVVRIINNDPKDNNRQSNFTIMYQSGLAVQAANKEGFLHVIVALPELYYEQTSGLLGTWNDDPDDDFMPPNGDALDPSEDPEDIHNEFGEKWFVKSEDSRFMYYAKLDWNYYRDENFKPNFGEPQYPIWPPPNCSITEEDVDKACDDNFVCRYDYKTTLSEEVGTNTRDMELWAYFVRNVSETVGTCGYIEIPHSVREVDHYLVGGEVTITGCVDGYRLQGKSHHYTCWDADEGSPEPYWDPEPTSYCKSQKEIDDEKAKLATAIAVPICLLVVASIIAVAGFMIYRKKKRDGHDKPPSSDRSNNDHVNNAADDSPGQNEENDSRASLNSFNGSVVLSQELHQSRPPRPISHQQQHQQQPHNRPYYSHDAMIKDYEDRTRSGSHHSSNVSLTGIGAGITMDPQGLQRYSNVPHLNGRLNQSYDKTYDNNSFDNSIEKPDSHHDSMHSLPASSSTPYSQPPGLSQKPPLAQPEDSGLSTPTATPQGERIIPQTQPSTGRTTPQPYLSGQLNPSGRHTPQPYPSGRQTPQMKLPLSSAPAEGYANQAADDDDEIRMSMASKGSELSLQENQHVVYTPMGPAVDTIV